MGVLYGLTYLGHQVGGMISSWRAAGPSIRSTRTGSPSGSAGELLLLAAAISLRLPGARPGAHAGNRETDLASFSSVTSFGAHTAFATALRDI